MARRDTKKIENRIKKKITENLMIIIKKYNEECFKKRRKTKNIIKIKNSKYINKGK